jgi:hypothetical protein
VEGKRRGLRGRRGCRLRIVDWMYTAGAGGKARIAGRRTAARVPAKNEGRCIPMVEAGGMRPTPGGPWEANVSS